MDVININGSEYQRASQLAKKFKYTADYIGQLCRAGKVDAQLVGRSWYVNSESLTEHKKNHSKKSRSHEDRLSEKPIENKPVTVKTRIDVEPVITKKVIKVARQEKNFSKYIDWKPAKYSADETDLLPPVQKQKLSQEIKINLADSTPVAINKKTQNTVLIPDPLPSVPLRGKLKVSSLNESFDDSDEIEQVEVVPNDIKSKKSTSDPKTTKKPVLREVGDKIKQDVSFSPKSISDPAKTNKPILNNGLIVTSAWLLLSLSILLLIITLFFSWEQTVTTTSYEATLRFSGLKFWQ